MPSPGIVVLAYKARLTGLRKDINWATGSLSAAKVTASAAKSQIPNPSRAKDAGD